MKKLFLFAIALCCLASFAFAQEAVTSSSVPATTVTITGTIIDNHCASAQKPEELGSFIKTHTKQCTLMPDCVASGYSIYADGKLAKFDKASSAKIEEFLTKADSKLDVTVTAKKAGDELSLVSIENQK